MSVSRLSKQSVLWGFPKQQTIWDQATATSSMDAIASTTLSADQAGISFTGIPATYTHLQIRGILRNNNYSAGGAEQNLRLHFNGDTGTNYDDHYIVGNGSGAPTAASDLTASNILVAYGIIPMSNQTASYYGGVVIDILDYANTTKYKTTRALAGDSVNASGSYIFLSAGCWRSTAAITDITLNPQNNLFTTYSQLTLYGIK